MRILRNVMLYNKYIKKISSICKVLAYSYVLSNASLTMCMGNELSTEQETDITVITGLQLYKYVQECLPFGLTEIL